MPDEDNLGRLSMWRAYGGRNGVALVLNRTPFEAETDDLKAYSAPVFYGDVTMVEAQFQRTANDINRNAAILSGVPVAQIIDMMFLVLRFTVLCTKHPAFSEEKEWRIIYSPSLAKSEAITSFVAAIRGVPQIVQKIPLVNDLANGLHGAAIPDLLYRVIIGPTEDPQVMFDAFAVILTEAEVPNAIERIWVSGIPLRQW